MTITTQITEVVSGATITITTNSVLRGPPGIVTPGLQELADEAANSANSALASQQASSQSESVATIAAQDAAASAIEAEALAVSVTTLRQDMGAPNGSSLSGFEATPTASVPRNVGLKLDETFSAFDAGLTSGSSDTLRAAMSNAEYLQPMLYGSYRRTNGAGSTIGVVDEANFAGQTLGTSAPIGRIWHHYTDGTGTQSDNVGDGVGFIFKNAQNASRRPDKPSTYVGQGPFWACDTHDDAAGFAKRYLFLSRLAELVWTGVVGIATLWQNKAEDGVYGFQFKFTNPHSFMLRFLNGAKTVLKFENDATFSRAKISSHSDQTLGLYITADAGSVRLDAAVDIKARKPIRSDSGLGNLVFGVADAGALVESQTPFKVRNFNTSGDLPAASTATGSLAMLANIPIYSTGVNWRYVRDDAIII